MRRETEKSMGRITVILVDTSAYRESNSDFIGLNSALLPSFFSAISDKQIVLLTHPILEKEILKHIEESSIYKDYRTLTTQLAKCKDVLNLAKCNDDELFKRISDFDIKAKTFETFTNNYTGAIHLGYPDPEIIFEQYFSAIPPFSATGKKKSEFPDAFVIEAAKQFLNMHPNDVLMVVSKDGDWERAFSNMNNVIICDSISNAVAKINRIESVFSEEIIDELFRVAYDDMVAEIRSSAESECFSASDYEFIEDFEVANIQVESISDLIVPLKVTRSSLLFKTTVTLVVDGSGVVIDEDSSVWDKEDGDYIFTVYADMSITEGVAEVECEIQLEFDFDNPTNTVQISHVKFNNRFDIEVYGGTVELSAIEPEIDARGDMMDTLEDYDNH